MAVIKRALISVSDKTGIVEFAEGLSKFGVEILSTGGTASMMREAGLEVKDVSEHTGYPEMLDGRVKTLHPKIHGGLLGLRDNPAHVAKMAEHDITPIDMVVVNLYPFEATVAKPGLHPRGRHREYRYRRPDHAAQRRQEQPVCHSGCRSC